MPFWFVKLSVSPGSSVPGEIVTVPPPDPCRRRHRHARVDCHCRAADRESARRARCRHERGSMTRRKLKPSLTSVGSCMASLRGGLVGYRVLELAAAQFPQRTVNQAFVPLPRVTPHVVQSVGAGRAAVGADIGRIVRAARIGVHGVRRSRWIGLPSGAYCCWWDRGNTRW